MNPVNIAEYEALARERMGKEAFDYVAGGAEDEVTLRENRAAFGRIRLLPRVLVDVSTVELSTRILGQTLEWPVLLAPAAFQTLAHAEGELATVRAAAASRTVMVVSTMTSFSLEEIATAAEGPKWFQLYCYRDREVTQRLVERAEAAGYSAVCVTVDLARVGRRERDVRNEFQLPAAARPKNFEGLVDPSLLTDDSAFHEYVEQLVDPSLTWESVDWLRSITSLPVLLKGILTAEDARLAVEHAVDGIVVSNHGGRQLDGVPATIDCLSDVVAAVEEKAEVLLDGGVRRGTDVVKALALGARAVLIGRPYVWGLAVDGEAGVAHVLAMLREEVEVAMALMGCPTVADITRDRVRIR